MRVHRLPLLFFGGGMVLMAFFIAAWTLSGFTLGVDLVRAYDPPLVWFAETGTGLIVGSRGLAPRGESEAYEHRLRPRLQACIRRLTK